MENSGEAEQETAALQAKEAPPALEELCFLTPLYARLEALERDYLENLRFKPFSFDMYCVFCEKESHFKVSRPARTAMPPPSLAANYFASPAIPDEMKPGYFSVTAVCSRRPHAYEAKFHFTGTALVKYGQLPSIADIEGAELRRYRSDLPNGYFSELSRAIGLASHGIGIGAFVYLRRIFERLIQDRHAQRIPARGPIDGFDTMRMDQKVASLREELPAALTDNSVVYAILSRGIHELSEHECKLYFPVVKAAIINILDEDHRSREREEQSRAVSAEVARINEALKGKKG